MEKFFNTVGPNQPDIYYTPVPIDRVNWPVIYGETPNCGARISSVSGM